MAITINNFCKKAFQFFVNSGMTKEGASGLCGNLYSESAGFYSNRVEFLCLQRLRENGQYYTDDTYTAAVNNGTITKERFLNPLPGKQYGYGLAQHTSPSRKKLLYERTVEKGLSIADENAQLEYILWELKNLYKSVYSTLLTTKSIQSASDVVLRDFESPASWQSLSGTRASYAKDIYNALKDGASIEETKESEATMTETELRKSVADFLVPYIGIKEGSAKHKEILSIFNNSGLCTRYKMTTSDAWCATAVSAAFIKLGLAGKPGSNSVFECVECYCESVINMAKAQGTWVENDAYVPTTGDVILYDWNDSGSGDNKGLSDHIGIVVSCDGKTIKVIEGNMNDTVGYRTISVNGKYIRGFITPKYSLKAKNHIGITKEDAVKKLISFADECLKIGATYSNSGNKTSYVEFLKQKKPVTNCALIVSHWVQKLGALPTTQKFYGYNDGTIKGKGVSYLPKVAILYDYRGKKKYTKDIALQPGDILTYYTGSTGHTNVYIGTENGKKKFVDFGRGTSKNGNGKTGWSNYYSYGENTHYYVAYVIRLNWKPSVTSTTTSSTATAATTEKVKYRVIENSYSVQLNAQSQCNKINKAGIDCVVQKLGLYYCTQCGLFENRDNAVNVIKKLNEKGFKVDEKNNILEVK